MGEELTHPEVAIFVVSHLDELLAKVPKTKGLVPINLDNLQIPERFQGNNLAENRLFFSKAALETNARVIGTISARWEERFPDQPRLQDLANHAASLRSNEFFAPLCRRISSRRELHRWVKLQDIDHPGMGDLLNQVLEADLPEKAIKIQGFAVLGGQVILSKQKFLELQQYVINWIIHFMDLYGDKPPFKYSCDRCGRTFEDGTGRWNSNRHLGFLAERLVSLFFVTSTNNFPALLEQSVTTQITRLSNPPMKQAAPLFQPTKVMLVRLMNRGRNKCRH